MYRSTSYSTTSVSSQKFLFKCTLFEKLPQLKIYCVYEFDLQKYIDKNVEIKKVYADAKCNDLEIRGKALLKRNKSNKLFIVYPKDRFIKIERNGNCVTAYNDDLSSQTKQNVCKKNLFL